MKKIWKYLMVALAGLALLACSNKELVPEEEPVEEGYIYNIEIVQTKAVFDENHMAWEGGDVIGWFTDKAGSSEIDMSKDPRRFTVSSTAAMAAGSKVYAYAPYKAGEQSETAAPLSIPTSQSGDDIKDAMPMVALPIELAADMDADTPTSAGQAYFIGLGSVIRYNVYTSDDTYGEEKVESITFTSTSNIAGDFTVNLTGVSEESLPTIDDLDQKSVTSTLPIATTVGNSKPNGIKVYQVIAPGKYTGTITVTTDIATYEYPIDEMEFSFGKIKTLNVDLASVNAIRESEKEAYLVNSKWALTDYYESWTEDHVTDGYNAMGDAAVLVNTHLVFSSDHSFSLENFAYFKDYSGIELPFTPENADGNWILKSNATILRFSNGAFPMVITGAGDLTSVEWTIYELTSTRLHIYAYDSVAKQWTNLIFTPIDVILTSKTWKINSFGEYYGTRSPDERGADLYADDAITFNPNHTIAYSIENGIFYWDYSATVGYGWAPAGTEKWALEQKADGTYLTLSGGGIPLMMVTTLDAVNGSFKILELSENLLSLYMPITGWGEYKAYVDFVPVP